MDGKPAKPSPDYPLFAHASGQWAKKIDGQFRYFGPWADPSGALEKYRRFAGGIPEAASGAGEKSSKFAPLAKARKPRADFPLFPHANGQFAKKIRGRLHYFGSVDDPQAALDRYLEVKDDLLAGRAPRTAAGGLTLRDVLNRFLTSKQRLMTSGELAPRTFDGYKVVCERISKSMDVARLVSDLRADDFEKLRADLAKTHGPTSLANDITRIRSVFKYAYDTGLISQPIRFGDSLKKPGRRLLRLARQRNGLQMFEPPELRRMLKAASVPLRAMILLGVNSGFGNHDCGLLPISAVDLDGGWVDFARPKTGTPRRCPLWPETVSAIRQVLRTRPRPLNSADNGLLFITSHGGRWTKDGDRPISKEMIKLLKSLRIKRPGLSFYCLRRTFETVGGETRDQVAVDHIMGHSPDANDMAAVYRQRISDERLIAVTNHVRAWLFGKTETQTRRKARRPGGKRKNVRGQSA
jgi:integrase